MLQGHLPYPWARVHRWRELEPTEPHLAMPPVLFLAKVSAMIMFGWPRQVFLAAVHMLACLASRALPHVLQTAAAPWGKLPRRAPTKTMGFGAITV